MKNDIVNIPAEYLPDISELTGDLARIAQAVEGEWPGKGVRIAMLMGKLFPGIPLYLRNIDGFARQKRDSEIRREYDLGQTTAKDLAIKTGLSQRRIEQILAEEPSQAEIKAKQRSLF